MAFKIISIGCNCNLTFFLKQINKRNDSYPFDWIWSNIDFVYKSFNEDYFEFTEIEKLNAVWDKPHPHTYIFNNNCLGQKNRICSAVSVHDADNKSESEFKKMIHEINKKYKRRFNRLYNELNTPGNNIILIRNTLPINQGAVKPIQDNEDKINKLIKLFKKKFVANIKLVVIDKNLIFDDSKIDNDIILFYSYQSFEKYLKSNNPFV
jgi:hypothetical protein